MNAVRDSMKRGRLFVLTELIKVSEMKVKTLGGYFNRHWHYFFFCFIVVFVYCKVAISRTNKTHALKREQNKELARTHSRVHNKVRRKKK